MSILAGAKPDTLTYWQVTGYDGYGDPQFSSPEERSVRWENKNEFFYGADGQGRQSESVIYDDVNAYNVGDYVYRGSSFEADPRDQTGFRRIKAVHETKSLDGTESVYKLMIGGNDPD